MVHPVRYLICQPNSALSICLPVQVDWERGFLASRWVITHLFTSAFRLKRKRQRIGRSGCGLFSGSMIPSTGSYRKPSSTSTQG